MIRIQIRGTTQSSVRGTAQAPRWALWLGLAMATAMGLVLVTVGIGLVLLIAPVAVAGIFYARWRLRRMLRDLVARQGGDPFQRKPDASGIIEADYVVVEEPSKPRQP
jgi:hypothetical protein